LERLEGAKKQVAVFPERRTPVWAFQVMAAIEIGVRADDFGWTKMRPIRNRPRTVLKLHGTQNNRSQRVLKCFILDQNQTPSKISQKNRTSVVMIPPLQDPKMGYREVSFE
jgi:hypothetical protein